jgi:hypothetical protein
MLGYPAGTAINSPQNQCAVLIERAAVNSASD